MEPQRPKFDWYETDTAIVINVLVKKMAVEGVSVAFEPRSLLFKYSPPSNAGDGQPLVLELKFPSSIVPSECSYKVGAVKAEIKLRKVANLRWGKLEADQNSISAPMTSLVSLPPPEALTEVITKPQQKMRKWEDTIKEIEKEEADTQGVEKLFQQIYSNSDEETRRAMNKSFMESNGTVLSTNWKDVGKKEVEMQPGEGGEWKKW